MKKMTNSELYKASFDKLHLSGDFEARLAAGLEKEREENKVNNIRVFGLGRVAAAAIVLTLTCGSVCYAADLGGIRTRLQLWINGLDKNVEVTDMGDGSFVWTDENGENHGFGGVSETEDGRITTMPANDMSELINNSAQLEFKDGRIIFHYHNLSEDVTDKNAGDGSLHVHVNDPANPNTYFDFEEIKNGTYSVECSPEAKQEVKYHEADATDLISGEPVEAFDEDTGVSITTTTTE